MGGAIKILTFEEVCILHYRAILLDPDSFYTESNYNLKNEGSLRSVLHEITYKIFGHDQYPTLVEKASVLCWRIIEGHIFNDGNKRTGLMCLMTMLELNGYWLSASVKEALNLALNIADHNSVPLEELTDWVRQHIAPFDTSAVNPSAISSLTTFISDSTKAS